MKTNILTFLLLVLGLMPVFDGRLYAQETLFVHKNGESHAYDLSNVVMTTAVTGVIRMLSGGVAFYEPTDSITFSSNGKPYTPKGWWGDLRDGSSRAYYQSHLNIAPDVEMLCNNGICHEAYCNVAKSDSLMGDSLLDMQKAGRKWRYVRNTLGGKGTFRFSVDVGPVHVEPLYLDAMTGIDMMRVSLTDIFSQLASEEAREVLNYWYKPLLCTELPAKPVFGKVNGDYSYEHSFPNSTSIKVMFDNPYYVTSDTICITYPDEETAIRDYGLMLEDSFAGPAFRLNGCEIVIVENFDAMPIEEVMRWLVKFDMDICKPNFLEEE